MSVMELLKWEKITREERFYTSILFHELRRDPEPFWAKLSKSLPTAGQATVIDVGYEVCFFRDMHYSDHMERHRDLEKQTFDLILTLSTGAFVIVEAKAQQSFGIAQLKNLREACICIQNSKKLPEKHRQAFLVGLCSSRAACTKSAAHFDALIRWSELAQDYPAIKDQVLRANELFRC